MIHMLSEVILACDLVVLVAAPVGTQHSSLCPNKAMETATHTLPSRLTGPRPITGHCFVGVNWSLAFTTEEQSFTYWKPYITVM